MTLVYLYLASTKLKPEWDFPHCLPYVQQVEILHTHTLSSYVFFFGCLTYFFYPAKTSNFSAILDWSSKFVGSQTKMSFHSKISHLLSTSPLFGFNCLVYLWRFGLVYNGSSCKDSLTSSLSGTSDSNWGTNSLRNSLFSIVSQIYVGLKSRVVPACLVIGPMRLQCYHILPHCWSKFSFIWPKQMVSSMVNQLVNPPPVDRICIDRDVMCL